MALSFDLMILGVVTLIYVLFVSFGALKILIKYHEYKEKAYLTAGLSIFGLATPWSGVAFNFISVVFFNITPSMELYFFLHGAYIPISNFLWLMTCLDLMEVKPILRKGILITSGAIYLIVEIIYVVVIFTDTTLLGTSLNEIQVDYSIFSELFLLCALIIMTVLGFWLSIQTMKFKNKKLRLKGKLLLCGFILFTLAAILEITTPTILMVVIARILVMFCAVLLYGGFILPKWMEKLFLGKIEI